MFATCSQTFPCSVAYPRFCLRVVLWNSALPRRILCGEKCLLGENSRPLYPHRPCSTQETGILVTDSGGIRNDALTIRFCLAPTNSVPSTIRTHRFAKLVIRSSGTDPPSLTSSTITFFV